MELIKLEASTLGIVENQRRKYVVNTCVLDCCDKIFLQYFLRNSLHYVGLVVYFVFVKTGLGIPVVIM